MFKVLANHPKRHKILFLLWLCTIKIDIKFVFKLHLKSSNCKPNGSYVRFDLRKLSLTKPTVTLILGFSIKHCFLVGFAADMMPINTVTRPCFVEFCWGGQFCSRFFFFFCLPRVTLSSHVAQFADTVFVYMIHSSPKQSHSP